MELETIQLINSFKEEIKKLGSFNFEDEEGEFNRSAFNGCIDDLYKKFINYENRKGVFCGDYLFMSKGDFMRKYKGVTEEDYKRIILSKFREGLF